MLPLKLTIPEMAERLKVSERQISYDIHIMREDTKKLADRESALDVLMEYMNDVGIMKQHIMRNLSDPNITPHERFMNIAGYNKIVTDNINSLQRMGVMNFAPQEFTDWKKDEEEFRKRVLRVKAREKKRHEKKANASK